MRRDLPAHGLALAALASALTCSAPRSPGFAGTGGIDLGTSSGTSTPAASSSSSGDSSAPGHDSSAASTTSTSADSPADDTLDSSSPPPDLGVTGCAGKVDFVFVLSNQETMEPHEHQMKAAVPAFLETLEQRFADFDNHVLVMDGNGTWGSAFCQDCYPTCPHGPPEYPCLQPFELEDCDLVEGAGVTFPVGWGTQNKRCDVFGGHRYMVAGDPDAHDTFLCLASVGIDGGDNAPIEVMLSALRYDLVRPGGCNAGFLREDALLVLVLVGDTYDYSAGDPEDWAAELLAHKDGNGDAVVLLQVTTDIDAEQHLCLPFKPTNPAKNKARQLHELMPQSLYGSICAPSWGPFFEEAADVVLAQCDVFAPG